MCGIIGVCGGKEAAGVILKGLKHLEYRGYDSAGVALVAPEGIVVSKVAGSVDQLFHFPHPAASLGIGHTRWATHGRPTEVNAHPHTSCDGRFAVVHNGIIENYRHLRAALEAKGHRFQSETDTEVVAHLLEDAFQGDLVAAVQATVAQLEGSYALAILSRDEPDTLVAARQKSPLIVGVGEGAHYIASDVTPLLEYTRRVVYLMDGEVVVLKSADLEVYSPRGEAQVPVVHTVTWSIADAERGGYEHFMLKEIHDQERTLHELLRGKINRLDQKLEIEGSLTPEDLRRAQRILILACGSSYNAGLLGKYLIERLARIPVDVQLASEYRYGEAFQAPGTIAIAVSQSGETADTLEGLRKARRNGYQTLAVTNVVGSTLTREADGVFYIRAGPEISVAATKSFTNQLLAFYLFAAHLGAIRHTLTPTETRHLIADLKALPRAVNAVIQRSERIAEAGRLLATQDHAFFLGRHAGYPTALEGALKLKEISYIHAEGYAAGELKHGPLALLAPGVPVVALAAPDHTYPVMVSNIQEVRARDAYVIALAPDSDLDIGKVANEVIPLPDVNPVLFPVVATVAMQLLAYHAAKARGCNIDKPRNLAKSVTVE
ncbi:MAG TPA: glutamine--fructose-6-phosphate transaminase (isomerizing) [Candidatus Thermoplasmatota archaeon]|nr:glutamine--fructose-6-phosphate transaminase (isomerizing) [Candidatus Thermoplasmatota archaeon]